MSSRRQDSDIAALCHGRPKAYLVQATAFDGAFLGSGAGATFDAGFDESFFTLAHHFIYVLFERLLDHIHIAELLLRLGYRILLGGLQVAEVGGLLRLEG